MAGNDVSALSSGLETVGGVRLPLCAEGLVGQQ